MMLVTPKVFLIGYTTMDLGGLLAYLNLTGQKDFIASLDAARDRGLSDGECLCSFYAKLCYKSLVEGKNVNITRTRDISDNVKGAFSSGHGSVFEHASVNFVATDVSRVLTHELVRHRAGWAYSQTSGRYCRLEEIDVVFDPILEGCETEFDEVTNVIEKNVYIMECKKGLRIAPPAFPNSHFIDCYLDLGQLYSQYGTDVKPSQVKWIPNDKIDFDKKKKITSAIRRIAPNGQSNEIGYTVNFRALRHFIQVRSSRHAEWEIRSVAHQMFHLLNQKFPLLFYDAKVEEVNGFKEISGMRQQPYDKV